MDEYVTRQMEYEPITDCELTVHKELTRETMLVIDVPKIRVVSTSLVCLQTMRGFKEQVEERVL